LASRTQATALRRGLAQILEWREAHAGFDQVVTGLPAELRGKIPEGLPYSPWQLLEHIRLTQRDILEFCRNPAYQEQNWPADYWPPGPVPPSESAWEESVRAYHADLEALKRLALDSSIDLLGKVPAGRGQTYLREILLTADHTAYHLGELVVVRRLLGAWPGA
jgi:hypothetical protein